jgi:GTP-binding protein Era
MTEEALSTLGDVDAVVFMVDARTGATPADLSIAEHLRQVQIPIFLAVNKVDTGSHDASAFAGLGAFRAVHELSAVTGVGVLGLLDELVGVMPEGPMYYPDDVYTDRPERFIVQEYIREKIFSLTGEEVPYSTAVTVEAWEDVPERNLSVIHATIHVERPSQKAILIGKGGALIKQIGKLAREDMEKLLGNRVFLELHVGVEHNWTKDPRQLRRFGYRKD